MGDGARVGGGAGVGSDGTAPDEAGLGGAEAVLERVDVFLEADVVAVADVEHRLERGHGPVENSLAGRVHSFNTRNARGSTVHSSPMVL